MHYENLCTMKVSLSLLFLIFALNVMGQVPVFEWAANLQWVNELFENDVTTDSTGNTIIVGHFWSYQDFDPGPNELLIQSIGGEDIFILKLDSDGNLLWVKTFGSIQNDKALSVVTDSIGNVYVAGRYSNTIDFNSGPGVAEITPVSGQSFGFLLSLDANGDFRWVNQAIGFISPSLPSNQIAYSSDGHIYVTEKFSNTIDFDPGIGTYNMTASNSTEPYLQKLDLNGNFVWVKQFNGWGQGQSAVSIHSSENIFLTGSFSETIDLDPGGGVDSHISSGLTDVFVVKLNSSGDYLLGTSFGGTDIDEVNHIKVDNVQNIIISGRFRGTADFDPGSGVAEIVSEGDRDPYVVKLDALGNYQWSHSYGGLYEDFIMGMDVDLSGNTYLTGSFYDSLDFDPGPGLNTLVADLVGQDIFITKLGPSGNLNWVKHFPTTSSSKGTSITIASDESIHVAGEYDEIVDFNPGEGNAIYNCVGGRDGFNLKFSQCYQSNPIPDVAVLSDTIASCSITSLTAPTASEFCLGTITGIPDVTFPIDVLGNTTITWTYDAGNGFLTTQTQLVTIIDTTAPQPTVANLPNVNAVCSINSLTPPTATDNCSGTITVTNDANFPVLSNTTVTWTYDDGNGNTTTQTQQITIQPIDNTINQPDAVTLNASASGFSYQWLDCDNGNTPINGETAQTFVAITNGSYAVEITNGVCTVTSDCMTISEVGLIANTDALNWFVAPNPSTDGVFTIQLPETDEEFTLAVLNELGQAVDYTMESTESGFTIRLAAADGVYLLRMTSLEQTLLQRLVKG